MVGRPIIPFKKNIFGINHINDSCFILCGDCHSTY